MPHVILNNNMKRLGNNMESNDSFTRMIDFTSIGH